MRGWGSCVREVSAGVENTENYLLGDAFRWVSAVDVVTYTRVIESLPSLNVFCGRFISIPPYAANCSQVGSLF